MSRHVVLFSGGLDSFITLNWVEKTYPEKEVLPVYFKLGHFYQPDELRAIHNLYDVGLIPEVTYDESFDLGDWEGSDFGIPMRNSILAHGAARYGDMIWLTIQEGETDIPDRSPKFLQDVSGVLSHLNERNILVYSPFLHKTKVEMVKWYMDAGLPPSALAMTSSCYQPVRGKPCGSCGACFRRFVAFQLNGLVEEYAVNPWESTQAKAYLQKGQAGLYGYGRSNEIVEALAMKGVI